MGKERTIWTIRIIAQIFEEKILQSTAYFAQRYGIASGMELYCTL